MTPKIINGICQHINTDSAGSVLWISASVDDLPVGLPCTHCLPEQGAITEYGSKRFDYAVLADLPGSLDKPAAEALIARMRDVNAQKVFWIIDDKSPWKSTQVISLGFHQLQQDDKLILYGFDINNYKTTPDWLSAKNWANPERWDKKRW